jgi:hypothetical protein
VKKRMLLLFILLLSITASAFAASASSLPEDSVGDDDITVEGPLDEYSGLWVQEGADGTGVELQLDPGGTGHITKDGQSAEIVWKVEEGPFYVLVTVYDDKNDILYEYQATVAGGLYHAESGMRLVRPEPDNLEIISYDKAQKVEPKVFAGTWEITDMKVTLIDPPMSMSLGADFAYDLMGTMTGISPKGPLRIAFDSGAHMTDVQFGETIDHHLPQLAYYFSGDALYIRDMGKEFTMVFFYVGKDTLHMMATPNPTPDVGTCIIVFQRSEVDITSMAEELKEP